MPSNTPLTFTFSDQNLTIRATFLLTIAIPVIQELLFHPITVAGPFRNFTKIRRPTNNVRRLSGVPHGTYSAPTLNMVNGNPILT